MNRRRFLSAVALPATAGLGTAVAVEAAARAADLTAIPTEVADKIVAWQNAHRTAVQAAKAYSGSLQRRPIDRDECDRCRDAMREADAAVGPARETMIVALWRVRA